MENLLDSGRCRAIGLSDISLNDLLPIYPRLKRKWSVNQIKIQIVEPESVQAGLKSRFDASQLGSARGWRGQPGGFRADRIKTEISFTTAA
jgi:hypothetical protein